MKILSSLTVWAISLLAACSVLYAQPQRGARKKVGQRGTHPVLLSKTEPLPAQTIMIISPKAIVLDPLTSTGSGLLMLNNTAKVPTKVMLSFPFAVKLDSDNPEMRFEPNDPTQIMLVNGDDVAYPVDWKIYVGGRLLYDSLLNNATPITLPQKGTDTFPFTPPWP